MRTFEKTGLRTAALLLTAPCLVLTPLRMNAQTVPLTVSGVFSSGYYQTWTRGQANQQINFVPASVSLDINGYYMSPDFLNFTILPEFVYGPQASEAGFQGGNGVSMRITALRKLFPLTLRYSNLRVSDVYFGSLSQVSAYRLATRTSDLGLTWNLKYRDLPAVTIDTGLGSVGSNSGIAGIPDYVSHVSHFNVDVKHLWHGWDIEGFSHLQSQQSDLFAPSAGALNTSALKQNLVQSQASGRRTIWADSEVYVDGGRQSTANLLLGMPINLTTSYANGNLRLFQRKRWKSAFHAGYSSNVSGQVLNSVVSGLGAGGPGTVVPDTTTLSLLERSIGSLNFNGTTTFQVTKDLGFYGRVDQSSVFTPPADGAVNASFLSASAGVTYSKRFEWLSVSGQYARELGSGSVTGQSGRLSGDNYLVSFQAGKAGSTLFDGSIHGNSESIQNAQPVTDRSLSAEGSISQHLFGRLSIRGGGGWQGGNFQSGGSQFLSKGYTGRFGIEHPRLQLSATLNSNLGSSLPLYSQLYGDIAIGSVLAGVLRPVPSDLRAVAVTLHATPVRKLEISVLWTHSLQHLDGVINNDFQILDAHLSYHFRRIQMDFGFTDSSQIFTTFTTYPETRRGRVYLRISRNAKLL